MKNCILCPRGCGADRTIGTGVCHAPSDMIVARAALHFWEEPCISGTAGSGAVFFSGCSLGCIYCQNHEISGGSKLLPLPGIVITEEKLAAIFLRLQNEDHANNINLVTACHYVPHVVNALERARKGGLMIPVVYNSSGYEKVETLRMLDGLVDIYLPDYKYHDPEMAGKYSHAADYPEVAQQALEEMVRQKGTPSFYERDGQQLMAQGVIVRHLLLPGHVKQSKQAVRYLYERYGDRIYISIMNQYTPPPYETEDPLLNRKVTKREYERMVDYALEIGITQAFIQEGETAQESFIPSFHGEGVGDCFL